MKVLSIFYICGILATFSDTMQNLNTFFHLATDNIDCALKIIDEKFKGLKKSTVSKIKEIFRNAHSSLMKKEPEKPEKIEDLNAQMDEIIEKAHKNTKKEEDNEKKQVL